MPGSFKSEGSIRFWGLGPRETPIGLFSSQDDVLPCSLPVVILFAAHGPHY